VQHIGSVVATLHVDRLWMDGIRQCISLPAVLSNRGHEAAIVRENELADFHKK
jgi:hypothetical protein